MYFFFFIFIRYSQNIQLHRPIAKHMLRMSKT